MSSMNNLSVDGEFRYIVTWFTEWSVLQREDFVPVLVAWLVHHEASSSEPGEGVCINGVTNSVANAEINDKPMSLFQCRIKLFNEWSPKWPLDFKYKLKEKIIEIDAKVGEKIISEIKGHSNGNNGIDGKMENGSEDVESAAATAATEENSGAGGAVDDAAAQPTASDNGVGDSVPVAAVVEATEEAVIADNHLAAVLNNETPVDDDDDDDNDDGNNVNVEAQTTVAAHEEEPAEPVAMQQTHDEEPVVAATAVTVANSVAEVPSIA